MIKSAGHRLVAEIHGKPGSAAEGGGKRRWRVSSDVRKNRGACVASIASGALGGSRSGAPRPSLNLSAPKASNVTRAKSHRQETRLGGAVGEKKSKSWRERPDTVLSLEELSLGAPGGLSQLRVRLQQVTISRLGSSSPALGSALTCGACLGFPPHPSLSLSLSH